MNIDADFEIVIQILVIGDGKVGKSNFIYRFTENQFTPIETMSSAGIDMRTKVLKLANKTVKYQVWDTPGQSRFRSLPKQFFLKVQGIVLLYAINDEDSFKSCDQWINSIREIAGEIPLLIVGNKCDLEDREVTEEQGRELAKARKAHFCETSAKTGENVIECMTKFGKQIINKSNSLGDNLNISLNSTVNINVEKKKCCHDK